MPQKNCRLVTEPAACTVSLRSLEVPYAERDRKRPRPRAIGHEGHVASFEEHILTADVEVQARSKVEAELVAPRSVVRVLVAVTANQEVALTSGERIPFGHDGDSLVPVVIAAGDTVQIPAT